MIALFRSFLATTLFIEVAIVVALLKPFQQPCFIRDYWYKFKHRHSQTPQVVMFLVTLVTFMSTVLELCVQRSQNISILKGVDTKLVLEFCASKMSLCYSCFFMQAYLIFLIGWLVHFSIRVARLLEFELMCRHAILKKEEFTEVSATAVIMTNVLEYTDRNENSSETHLAPPNVQRKPKS